MSLSSTDCLKRWPHTSLHLVPTSRRNFTRQLPWSKTAHSDGNNEKENFTLNFQKLKSTWINKTHKYMENMHYALGENMHMLFTLEVTCWEFGKYQQDEVIFLQIKEVFSE